MRNLSIHCRRLSLAVFLLLSCISTARALSVTPVVVHTTPGANTGSITLTPSPITDVLTYHWNTSATTAGITGLGVGTYTCTITQGMDSIIRNFSIGYNPVWDTLIKIWPSINGGIQTYPNNTAFDAFALGLNGLKSNETGWYSVSLPCGYPFNGLFGLFSDVNLLSNSEPVFVMAAFDDFLGIMSKGGDPISWGNYNPDNCYRFFARITLDSVFIDKYETDTSGLTVFTSIGIENLRESTGFPAYLPILNCRVSETGCSFGDALVKAKINVEPGDKQSTSASLSAYAKGGHPPYTYAWSNGGGASTLNSVPLGNYSVTITDDSSDVTTCSAFAGAYVSWSDLNSIQEDPQHVLHETGSSPSYGGENGFYGMAMAKNNLKFGEDGTIQFEMDRAGNMEGVIALVSSTDFGGEVSAVGIGVFPSGDEGGVGTESEIYFLGKDLSYLGNAFDSMPLVLGISIKDDSLYISRDDVVLLTIPTDSFPDLHPFVGLYDGSSVSKVTSDIRMPLAAEIIMDSCSTDSSGMLTHMHLTLSGGVPPYDIHWSTGDTGLILSGVLDSMYFVTITSARGDTVRDTLMYISPTISLTEDTVAICGGEMASLSAETGHNYQWSTGDTTAIITHVFHSDSTIYVTMTTNLGCTAKDTVWVDVRNLSGVTISPDTQVLCFYNTGHISITGGDIYEWSDGDSISEKTVPRYIGSDMTYTVTVSNSTHTQCEVVHSHIVISDVQAVVTPTLQKICVGDTATISASGGVSYAWQPTGDTLGTIVVHPDSGVFHQYGVVVIDSNGCKDIAIAYVTIDSGSVIDFSPDTVFADYGETFSIEAAGGTGYQWTTGDTLSILNGVMDGDTSYSVTARNENGCDAGGEVLVLLKNDFPTIFPDTQYIHKGDTAVITGYGGMSYMWSTGETSRMIKKHTTGNASYQLTITDALGGTSTHNSTVVMQALVVGVDEDIEIAIKQRNKGNVSCAPVEYEVEVLNNTASVQAVKLKITCSAQTTITLPNPNVSIFTLTGGSGIYYLDATLQANQNAKVTYYQNPSCELIPPSSIGTIVTISNTVDFVPGTSQSVSYNISDNDVLPANSNNQPITFTNIIDFYTISWLSDGEATVKSNDPSYTATESSFKLLGNFDGVLKFNFVNSCAGLQLVPNNPIIITIKSQNGTVLRTFATTSLSPTFATGPLPSGSIISVNIQVEPNSCFGGACNYGVGLSYGCSASNLCGTSVSGKFRFQNYSVSVPTLYRNLPNAGLYSYGPYYADPSPWDQSCFGEEVDWEYVVIVPKPTAISDLEIRLYRDVPGNQYTNIIKNSVEFDIQNGSTRTTYTQAVNAGLFDIADIPSGFYTNGMPSCNSGNTMAGEITIQPGSLFCQTCTLFVRFKTVRCCPDNAEPNDRIYSNFWKIDGTFHDDCSGAEADVVLGSSSNATQWRAVKTATNPETEFAYLNTYNIYDDDGAGRNTATMVMDKTTWDPNILGGWGPTNNATPHLYCGESYPIVVENKTFLGLVPGLTDYNMDFMGGAPKWILPGQSPLKTANFEKGDFIIRISPDDDIKVVGDVTLTSGSLSITRPVTSSGTPPVYRAVFTRSDIENAIGHSPITLAELKQFMTGSRTSFNVQYCCKANKVTPSMSVTMLYTQHCNGTDLCEFPLGQEEGSFQGRCPGCVTPGAVVTNARLERSTQSYGYEDADDDGRPEPHANYLKKIGSTYVTANNKLNLNGSITGDQLVDITEGYYREGESVATGFTFAEWNTASPGVTTDNLYLEYNFAEPIIPKPLTPPFTRPYTTTEIHISNVQVSRNGGAPVPMNIVNKSGGTIKDGYALMHINAADIGSGVHFGINDEFRITAEIELCGNPSTKLELENAHRMYFTTNPVHLSAGIDAGHNPSKTFKEAKETLHNAMIATSGNKTAALNHTGPMGTALFTCEGRSAVHNRYPVTTFYEEKWENGAGCSKGVLVETGSYIGEGSPGRFNHFPYEYKPVNGFDETDANTFAKGPIVASAGVTPDILHVTTKNITQLQFIADYMETEAKYRDNQSVHNQVISNIPANCIATTSMTTQTHFSAATTVAADYEPPYENTFTELANTNLKPQLVQGLHPNPTLLVGDEYFRQRVKLRALPVCSSFNPQPTPTPQVPQTVAIANTDVNATIPQTNGLCESGLSYLPQIVDDNGVTSSIKNTPFSYWFVNESPIYSGNTVTYPFTVNEYSGGKIDEMYFQIEQNDLENALGSSILRFIGIEEEEVINPGPPKVIGHTMILPVAGHNVYKVNGHLTYPEVRRYRLIYEWISCDLFINGTAGYPTVKKIPIRFFGSCEPILSGSDLDIDFTNKNDVDALNGKLCSPIRIHNIEMKIPAPNIQGGAAISISPAIGCQPALYQACIINQGEGGTGEFSAQFELPTDISVGNIQTKVNGISYTLMAIPTPVAGGKISYEVDLRQITEFADFINGQGLRSGAQLCLDISLIPQCNATEIPAFDLAWDFKLFCGETVEQLRDKAPPSVKPQYNPTNKAIENPISSSTCPTVTGSLTSTGGSCLGSLSYSYSPSTNVKAEIIGPNGKVVLSNANGTLSNLAAGSYELIVTTTGASSCSHSETAIVSSSAFTSLTATALDANCSTGAGGAIDLAITGSSGPYTYAWNNAATTEDISGLDVGTYSVTITATGGCTAVLSKSIGQSGSITLVNDVTDVTCGGTNTGAIDITVTGSAPYTYRWDKVGGTFSAATEDLSGLTAGTYKVIVTDAMMCTISEDISILDINKAVTATLTNPGNVLCSPGSLKYTYTPLVGVTAELTRSGTIIPLPSPGNGTVVNLPEGLYTLNVTDNNTGCSATSATVQIVSGAVSVSTTAFTDANCTSSTGGSIDVTATGGIPSYTYLWSNGAVTQDLTNLQAGTYKVTVTSTNGCTATMNSFVTIGKSGGIHFNNIRTHVECFDKPTGSIQITMTSGIAPFTYFWSWTESGLNQSKYTFDNSGDGITTLNNIKAGAYTIVVTDALGCTQTQTFNITQNTKLQVLSYTETDACGSNGIIDLGVIGGDITNDYIYSWSGPSNGTSTSGTIENLAPGDYTVTITDALGCSLVEEYTLGGSTAEIIIPSNTDICSFEEGIPLTVVTTGMTSPTYVWNGEEDWEDDDKWMDIDRFEETINADQPYPFVYSVTVTDGGCSITATRSIPAPSGVVLIGSGAGYPTVSSAITATLLASGGMNSQTNVRIMGRLTVDIDYSFFNSHVICYAGAEIFVPNNKQLILWNTLIEGCNKLWKGIKLEKNISSLTAKGGYLSSFYSTIEDARFAVYAPSGAIQCVMHTTFRDNVIGIFMPPDQIGDGPWINNRTKIVNNYMGCRFMTSVPGALKLPYQYMEMFGTQPDENAIRTSRTGWAGIHMVQGGAIRIGVPGNPYSVYFDSLANGIVAENTTLQVRECYFKGIRSYNYTTTKFGNGIVAFSRSKMNPRNTPHGLEQIGFGKAGAVNFLRCDTAINVNAVSLSTTQNRMKDVKVGVSLRNAKYRRHLIDYNKIDAGVGVMLMNNDPVIGLSVGGGGLFEFSNRNEITIDDPAGAGIYISEDGNRHQPSIANNKITVNNGAVGIYCIKTNGSYVISNDVYVGGNGALFGIYSIAGNHTIAGNKVVGSGLSLFGWLYSGIVNWGGQDFMFCNYTHNINNGIFCQGECTGTLIHANEMENHKYGLLYGQNLNISAQVHRGNIWTGTYTQYGAANAKAPYLSPQQLRAQGIEYDAGDGSTLSPISINPSTGWFFNRTGSTPICNPGTWLIMSPEIAISGTDSLIMSDSLYFTDFADELKWQARKRLYAKLDKNDTLITPGSMAEVFMLEMDTSVLGRLHQAETLRNELMRMDSTLQDEQDSVLANRQTMFEELDVLEMMMADSVRLNADSTAIVIDAELDSLIDRVSTGFLRYESAYELHATSLDSIRKVAADSALAKYATINPVKDIEHWNKDISMIYLRTLAQGIDTFISADWDTIIIIAFMCPDKGGDATALARSLYVSRMGPIVFNDDSLCPTVSSKKDYEVQERSKQGKVETQFTLYPNPSSGKVYIGCTAAPENSCDVVLVNAMGQQVMMQQKDFTANVLEIDTKGLSSGLYTVRLMNNGKQLYTSKLSLVKNEK